ncbi:MAG: hypothetical protein KKE79_09125 [Actinobacteria bacterium]|nr:hypothetical protein [Actinomycetota bacterium]MBU4301246.1 hypothetical protein [Actinomycetota bacterium]MBU4385955.1 hypothetical protein [Actinomycetota bacterium]MBU4490778.1 hypothetical protein [Actinomycetota bacterium]MCG2795642.1 hypothetical protein [Actinomycetes bacterium]
MEIILLLLLMVSAGVFFLPGILKERALNSPLNTVSDFRRGMTALAISTNEPDRVVEQTCYSYSARGQNDPEPYIRRRDYVEYEETDLDEDFIPYPSNKARAAMETKQHRIIALLLIVALGTGIASLFPSLGWIIPLHIAILVILAAYTFVVILLPSYNRQR